MKHGKLIAVLGLCLSLLASSCSKVPRDSEYRVLVDVVTIPPGASFLGPGRVPQTTPAQIAMRDGYSLTIVLEKEGYEPHRVKIGPRMRPKERPPPFYLHRLELFAAVSRGAFENLLGGHDPLVMAPNPVNIDLTPIDGSLARYPDNPRSVDAKDIDCETPIELSQNCGNRAGPSRRLRVRGLDVLVAGSRTGQEVLVIHDHVHPVSLGLFPEKYGPDACTRVLRQALEFGPKLLHLTAVTLEHVTYGCYLEFNENVYDALKSFTVED